MVENVKISEEIGDILRTCREFERMRYSITERTQNIVGQIKDLEQEYCLEHTIHWDYEKLLEHLAIKMKSLIYDMESLIVVSALKNLRDKCD